MSLAATDRPTPAPATRDHAVDPTAARASTPGGAAAMLAWTAATRRRLAREPA
jgi:hypothetical protein